MADGAGAAQLQPWDVGDDDQDPPPRPWLLESTFCKGFLSGLSAAGGVGKTALRLVQLLTVATGRENLTGDRVYKRARVLILSLEDDVDESRRRIMAAIKHHNISRSELRGWLCVANPIGLKLARTSPTNNRQIEAGELDKELRRVIRDKQIELVAIDPFLKTHEVEENDNGLIDQVCVLLTRIAIDCGCAVDIIHHTAKGLSKPGDSDRARGASALRDGVRLFYTLTPMSRKEAEGFGVSESQRLSLVRLDSAKVNIMPPPTEAKWFRLVSVELGNGTDTYPSGDRVQTCERWYSPDRGADISPEAMTRIFDQLEAGPAPGRHYSRAPNTGENREAWRVLQVHSPNLTKFQAQDELKRWLKAGFLVERHYADPVIRKQRLGLLVEKRPV